MALLEVEDLTVRYDTDAGPVTAVDGLSYAVERGETLAVVGESGAGKSASALAVLGLLAEAGTVASGAVRFDGRDLLALEESALRDLRGDRVAMVFQDPQAALNPVYAVGEQVAEAVRHHRDCDDAAARRRTVRLFDSVGIPDPATRYDAYPHQLSGGLCQRVLVAMALSCDPDLLIADEPATGLDATTRADVLDLLADAAADGTAVELITHDMGVVAGAADRALVVYAGRAVERATVEALFTDPRHPYTAGLLTALPRLGVDRDRLGTIPGTMPEGDVPAGCAFHPRCPYAEDVCRRTDPPLVDPATGDPRPGPAPDERAAACLAHTGDLDGDLDYHVERRGDGEADHG